MFCCVEFQLADKHAKLPQLGTSQSAAYDIYCVNEVVLKPGITQIDSGLILSYLSPNIYIQILSRSGLALTRNLLTCAGVVDSDFRGRIFILMHNVSAEPQVIHRGERLAQIVFLPIIRPHSETLNNQCLKISREDGCLGSTDTGEK